MVTNPITLPDLLSAGDAPVFGQWLVDDGDPVLAGDRVAEVLVVGVLVYVASPAEGTLLHSNVRASESLTIDAILGHIATDDVDSPEE